MKIVSTTVWPTDPESREFGVAVKVKQIGSNASVCMITGKYGMFSFWIVPELDHSLSAIVHAYQTLRSDAIQIDATSGCALFGIEESDLPGRFSTTRG